MVVRAKHNIFVSLIVFPSGPAAVRVPPIYKYSKITFVYANCSVPCLVKLESICLSGFASRAGCANVNPRQMSFRYRFCVRHKPKFSNSTNEKKKNTRKAWLFVDDNVGNFSRSSQLRKVRRPRTRRGYKNNAFASRFERKTCTRTGISPSPLHSGMRSRTTTHMLLLMAR